MANDHVHKAEGWVATNGTFHATEDQAKKASVYSEIDALFVGKHTIYGHAVKHSAKQIADIWNKHFPPTDDPNFV